MVAVVELVDPPGTVVVVVAVPDPDVPEASAVGVARVNIRAVSDTLSETSPVSAVSAVSAVPVPVLQARGRAPATVRRAQAPGTAGELTAHDT